VGRLRDGYESPLIMGVAEEVVDLFGTDAILYKPDECANANSRDPLYDEPAGPLVFRPYRIKAIFLEYRDDFVISPEGSVNENTNQIFVALNHVISAGVKPDAIGDYITEGDLIKIHFRGKEIIYHVIQMERESHFNNSDNFTGYSLDCKRSSKYAPERNILPPVSTM
jgi:hypothetical protein